MAFVAAIPLLHPLAVHALQLSDASPQVSAFDCVTGKCQGPVIFFERIVSPADTAEQISVNRVGDLSFSQKFLSETRTEGWGITRFGWALGYYGGAWHRSDSGPLDASGNLLVDGAIAIDRTLIPPGANVQITTLPTPWASRTFRATDIGVGIEGQHIDVFTGTGLAAEQETFRITSNNNRVCYMTTARD